MMGFLIFPLPGFTEKTTTIRLQPKNSYFHFAYGKWLLKIDTEQALLEFKKALSLFHDDFGLKDVLDQCYKVVKNYDTLKNAIPWNAEFFYKTGVFLLSKKDTEGAKKAFQDARRLAKDKQRIDDLIRKFEDKLN